MKVLLFVLFLAVSSFAVNLNVHLCKDKNVICFDHFLKDVKDYTFMYNKTLLRVKFYNNKELDINLKGYNVVEVKKKK